MENRNGTVGIVGAKNNPDSDQVRMIQESTRPRHLVLATFSLEGGLAKELAIHPKHVHFEQTLTDKSAGFLQILLPSDSKL